MFLLSANSFSVISSARQAVDRKPVLNRGAFAYVYNRRAALKAALPFIAIYQLPMWASFVLSGTIMSPLFQSLL